MTEGAVPRMNETLMPNAKTERAESKNNFEWWRWSESIKICWAHVSLCYLVSCFFCVIHFPHIPCTTYVRTYASQFGVSTLSCSSLNKKEAILFSNILFSLIRIYCCLFRLLCYFNWNTLTTKRNERRSKTTEKNKNAKQSKRRKEKWRFSISSFTCVCALELPYGS